MRCWNFASYLTGSFILFTSTLNGQLHCFANYRSINIEGKQKKIPGLKHGGRFQKKSNVLQIGSIFELGRSYEMPPLLN